MKTDRSIIADLPEKNEMTVLCTLTREQATLEQALVQASLAEIEAAEGIQRRGLILATLTTLKPVCDHPALFLHDGSALAGRSGTLERLSEMLEAVIAEGDRALIFTQYAEMGRLLKAHLEDRLGQEVRFLHGGTPARERDRMVVRFQDDPRGPRLFLLSLKAGSTGLNLTRANSVFHFDRWWNPAVENQATDRAFRIGQWRDVQVHTLLCVGTFEEALDPRIQRKRALAESIVGTSEAWITELGTEELRALFALRQTPRRPPNGIKAQTQRGTFGQTWWASRWVAALERLVDPGRLSRGRSYARSGQVLKLEVGPSGVEALVQGSRPTPYKVTIRFQQLSDAAWERVIEALAAQAISAARLLSGEMPQDIEPRFTAAGASLFPAVGAELGSACSCPDWANPCKHVAAVHELLGERFNADPFLLFTLRGRTKEQIAAALRVRRAGVAVAEPAPEAVERTAEAVSPPAEAPSLPLAPATFWTTSADLDAVTFSFEPPALDALPVKCLGRPSFWQSKRDFATVMEQAYRAISAHARALAAGEA